MVSAFAFCNALKAGASDPTLRVFGGRPAYPFEYPYVVRMEIQGKVKLQDSYKGLSIHVCTASVLSLVWTLTAGHCIDGADYMIAHHLLESELISLVIRYGSTENSFSAVIATVNHPTYKFINIKTSQLLRNDVGLLKTMPIKLDWYGKLSAMEYPSLMGQASVAVG
ncbi:trypsin-1-like [Ostrinia furnacalis]|uniref:trypsin-1-like n=1 Tax=Ostrinia furnacalis TaxID=93504 RepID=UPI00103A048A|nr:trypsin-1-like [Ostrinia furnacalis]